MAHTKISLNFNKLLIFSLLLAAFSLVQCMGSSPGGAPGAQGPQEVGGPTLSNQAGPTERPPVAVESGPQDDCRPYLQEGNGYEPEKVPESCREIYERWWYHEHLGTPVPMNHEVRIPLPPPTFNRVEDFNLYQPLDRLDRPAHDLRDFEPANEFPSIYQDFPD